MKEFLKNNKKPIIWIAVASVILIGAYIGYRQIQKGIDRKKVKETQDKLQQEKEQQAKTLTYSKDWYVNKAVELYEQVSKYWTAKDKDKIYNIMRQVKTTNDLAYLSTAFNLIYQQKEGKNMFAFLKDLPTSWQKDIQNIWINNSVKW